MGDEKKMMLVLLAGQSNMAGRGEIEPEDREEIPGLLMINRNFEWVPAVEPVTADRSFAGVGPGRTFGKLLLEANPGCTVGLVPTAVGGTPISAWKRVPSNVPLSSNLDKNHSFRLLYQKSGFIIAKLRILVN